MNKIAAKENLNPICTKSIKSQIDHYESEVKSYKGKDPFEKWSTYIAYLNQLTPEQRKEAGIKIHYVYQRCINSCQPYNYHNNEKFLKLFMQYNKLYETKPLVKFDWMYKHRYGLKLNEFYLEWAMLFEKDNQLDEAIRTIELGLTYLKNDCKLNEYFYKLKSKKLVNESHFSYATDAPKAIMQQQQQQQSVQMEKKKFSFNYHLVYPDQNEEFSFEEIRSAVYYKAHDLLKPALERETKKYIDEINELKMKLELATNQLNSNSKREINANDSDTKRHCKGQEATILANSKSSNENFDFTNVTQANQTSFWQTTRNNTEKLDMDETEDEFLEEKLNERSMAASILPPPPGLNETNVVLSLPNSSMLNSFHLPNSESVCFKSDDTKRISNMFHGAADETVSIQPAESIIIFQDKNQSVRDFSIFVDNNMSQVNRTVQVENLAPPQQLKNYNQDGSLFVYDLVNTTGKREALQLISNASSMDAPKFEMTLDPVHMNKTNSQSLFEFNPSETILNETVPACTRFISKEMKFNKTFDSESNEVDDFEPPVSSTCFLKPTGKRDALKLLEHISEDDSMEKELEKEKLLEKHLASNVKQGNETFKLLAEECFTSKTRLKQGNETEKSRFCGQEISWDNESSLQIGATAVGCAEETEINFSLIKSSFRITDVPAVSCEDNEPLNSEKLDQTFKADYLRLYFPNMSVTNTPGANKTATLTKIVDDQIREFDLNETKFEQINERSIMTFTQLGNPLQTLVDNLEETKLFKDTTMCADAGCETNMNETIVQAIRDPFSFDVKTRLLERGPIEKLKSNPKYKSLCTQAPIAREKLTVTLNDRQSYNIVSEIGKGAYAKIFLIQNKSKKEQKYALKVDKQATAWEFYIAETIQERLSEMIKKEEILIDVTHSIIRIEQFMKYNDGCFSTMKYYSNGSLLNLINYHVKNDLNFPYWFVIYLTLEMLNILDYLHKCQILHADIKADNFLIDNLPNSIEYFVANRTKCLVLIDFNRSIDLSMLPNEAEFEAKSANKSLLCCEMKANKSWTYQIDFFGIISSIHCIIFKKYMNVYTENDRYKITANFPRNYDSLFSKLFDTYLNIPSCKEIPNLRSDWIDKFIIIFKKELGSSFCKYLKYLKDLNSANLADFKSN